MYLRHGISVVYPNEPYPQLRHNAKITQKWRKVWGPSGILCMEGVTFRDVPREESMRKLW